jgi:hypothetical protein
MAMCFALRDYTSNMKVRMAVFQLKGSALLWWKTLLPQLNMAVEDVSWELFEERFRERYLSEEFIERQLNEFNALRQGGRTVPEYEARFMELLRYAPHLNTEKLRVKVNRFISSLQLRKEYAQGVQALCDPCAQRKGSSRRSRTPSGGEGVCGRISRGVAWDAARKRIGVYYRPETGD